MLAFLLQAKPFYTCILVSFFVHIDTTETASVGKLRSSAEVAFSKGDVEQALKLWTQVISLEPNNESNFYKRFRVYLRQNKLKEAISDLSAALTIKPNYEAVLVQRAKLQLKVGRCAESKADFDKLRTLNPASKDLSGASDADACVHSQREGDKSYAAGHYSAAKDHFTNVLKVSEASTLYLLHRAFCYFKLGDSYEAIADTGKVLKLEADNLEALEVRGNAYYVLGELDMAMNHYRKALKSDPEHDGCKGGYRLVKKSQTFSSKADKAISSGDYAAAVKNLLGLVETDPEHRTLVPKAYIDLAKAYRHLKQFTECVLYAKKAIEQNDGNAEAHRVLGNAYSDQEKLDEAVYELKRAAEISQDNEVIDEMRRAEAALKQSKQKNYYKTLDVSRTAKLKQIKKAYREKALLWHPDKHSGDEDKASAEIQFQAVAEAYEVLSDTEKRALYDRGEDPFGKGGQGPMDPFAHFNHFQGFPQGGGHNFNFRFGQ